MTVFVTSAEPDSYINALVFASEGALHPDEVRFVSVVEDGYNEESEGTRVTKVTEAVFERLECLSRGVYPARDGSEIRVPPDRYARCLAWLKSAHRGSPVIPFKDLDAELHKLTMSGQTIVDVTALKKNLLVDVVVSLVSRGFTQVYSFELKTKQRTFGVGDLIHGLAREDYDYNCLGRGAIVDLARDRMTRHSVAFRSLLLATIPVAAAVFVVQRYFSGTSVASIMAAVTTTSGIASWLFVLRRD